MQLIVFLSCLASLIIIILLLFYYSFLNKQRFKISTKEVYDANQQLVHLIIALQSTYC
jgi:hypothetical protein